MAIYWRLKHVPELADLPADVRRRAIKYATKKADKAGAYRAPCIFILAATVCLAAVTLVLDHYFPTDMPFSAVFVKNCLIAGGPFFLLYPVCIVACIRWFIVRTRPYIREFLTSGT